MTNNLGLAAFIFFLSLGATLVAAIVGRRVSQRDQFDADLGGRSLNKWWIGLSAGTTGNSGFIVTGAVGLGYAGGVHWLMLPIAWMLGDLLYWSLFPNRLNGLARKVKATTLSEIITYDFSGVLAKTISIIIALLLVTFLAMYTSAQWLAGRKFLSAVFDLSDIAALLFFSATIVIYSSIGGFRGSVYADALQAIIRLVGTAVAMGSVIWFVLSDTDAFKVNIAAAGEDFLKFFPSSGLVAVVGFVAGYAFAAIGFGLGQPQIVSRYFAGRSPEETRAAWWIYIGFVHGTWISMTVFGILLRGVMPGIADPETGLSLFFQTNINAIITGIIFADVYATIASTSNGLIVAIGQAFYRDVLSLLRPSIARDKTPFAAFLLIGIVTIVLSLMLPGNVFTIAISAVSKIGAAIAGPVLIKAMGWRNSALSILLAIVCGLLAAFAWEMLGYSAVFNEAGVGMVTSLFVNWVCIKAIHQKSRA